MEENKFIQIDKIEVKKFIEWVRYMLTELVITHQELANELCKSKKTIDRYMNDPETYLPKNEEAKKKILQDIWNFICKESYHKTYHHIDNQIFTKLFREHYHNLKETKKISQKEFAEKMGVEPKTISIWLHSEKYICFSPEQQYNILNTLLKFQMEKIYSNKYDDGNYYAQGGTHSSPYFITHIYSRSYRNLFILMQNKKIYKRSHEIMQSYISYPSFFYRLIEKQIVARLEKPHLFYQPDLPEKYHGGVDLPSDFTYVEFKEALHKICTPFREKSHKKRTSIPAYVNFSPVTNRIIQHHTNCAKEYSAFLTKENCSQFLELLENSEEWTKQLFEDIQTKAFDTGWLRKQNIPFLLNNNLTEESLLEFFSKCSPEMQKLLLEYPQTFLDTSLTRIQTGRDIDINIYSIYYHFLRKIEKISFSDVSEKLEQIVFVGYSNFSMHIKNYKENRLQAFYQGDDEYLKMAYLVENIPKNHTQDSSTEKDKEKFLCLYQPALRQNFFPLIKILECKLDFTKESWLIWRLVMIGKLINPQKTASILFEYINSADEVLDAIYDAFEDIDKE